MTRPVDEWKWVADDNNPHLAAEIFWLRMETIAPPKADLAIETFPPAPRQYEHHRTIPDHILKQCLRESREVNLTRSTAMKHERIARSRYKATAQTITERQTLAAERIIARMNNTKETA